MVLHTKTCKSQTDKGQVLVCFPRKLDQKTKRSAKENSKKNNQRRGWWPRPPY